MSGERDRKHGPKNSWDLPLRPKDSTTSSRAPRPSRPPQPSPYTLAAIRYQIAYTDKNPEFGLINPKPNLRSLPSTILGKIMDEMYADLPPLNTKGIAWTDLEPTALMFTCRKLRKVIISKCLPEWIERLKGEARQKGTGVEVIRTLKKFVAKQEKFWSERDT